MLLNMSVVYQYQQPPSPEADRSSFKKKVFILVGLIAACILVMALVLIFGSSRTVKRTDSDSKSQERIDATTKLMNVFASGDQDGAYTTFVDETNRGTVSKAQFLEYVYSPVMLRSTLDECNQGTDTTVEDPVTKETLPAVQVDCEGKDGYGTQRVRVSFMEADGELKYRSVTIQDAEAQNE